MRWKKYVGTHHSFLINPNVFLSILNYIINYMRDSSTFSIFNYQQPRNCSFFYEISIYIKHIRQLLPNWFIAPTTYKTQFTIRNVFTVFEQQKNTLFDLIVRTNCMTEIKHSRYNSIRFLLLNF